MTPDEPLPYEQRWVDCGADQLGIQVYEEPGPDAPALVIFPAMGVPARFYRPFATALRDAGLSLAVADLRGTGASTPRPSRSSAYGYAELVDDVGAVLEELKPRLDGRRLLLLGHSLGGQLCLMHLARSGATAVDGLVLVASTLPYWRAYPGWRGLGVWPYTQAIQAATTALRVWPGWGFGGRQARGVIRDWAYTARTGRFPDLEGAEVDSRVRAVSTPILAVSLEQDRYTPASTVDYLTGRFAAPVERAHYDGGVNHFTWARGGDPVAAHVAAFAAQR